MCARRSNGITFSHTPKSAHTSISVHTSDQIPKIACLTSPKNAILPNPLNDVPSGCLTIHPSNKGDLAAAIDRDFGSLDAMKAEFAKAAATRFGSGWAWLGTKSDGSLCVCSTANQDNPLMGSIAGACDCKPILGLDVWEHAYYLNYQNRRPDYINAFWSVVNWDVVGELFTKA